MSDSKLEKTLEELSEEELKEELEGAKQYVRDALQSLVVGPSMAAVSVVFMCNYLSLRLVPLFLWGGIGLTIVGFGELYFSVKEQRKYSKLLEMYEKNKGEIK